MFSRLRFPLKGSDESESLSDMDVGLVPPMVICKCRALSTCMMDWFLTWSDVSADPFRHVYWIGSSHGRM